MTRTARYRQRIAIAPFVVEKADYDILAFSYDKPFFGRELFDGKLDDLFEWWESTIFVAKCVRDDYQLLQLGDYDVCVTTPRFNPSGWHEIRVEGIRKGREGLSDFAIHGLHKK